ncbi:hypothetical protein NL676_012708 [Syzygium grande]|nr:hypothetical protein NL676_012708 [Syzygium grande]
MLLTQLTRTKDEIKKARDRAMQSWLDSRPILDELYKLQGISIAPGAEPPCRVTSSRSHSPSLSPQRPRSRPRRGTSSRRRRRSTSSLGR